MDKALWEVPCDTCGHACKLHVSIGDVCIVLRCPCIAAIPTSSRCPDCGGQYTPPMNPDHRLYCTGRKAD